MSAPLRNQSPIIIPVTHEEFEQFLHEETFMPECAHIDADGTPTCGGACPDGFVCATFTYLDAERGVDMVWYACAPPEVVARLQDRVIVDETFVERKAKFVAYRHDA